MRNAHQSKTIFINGAYGGPNAGDEAILNAIISKIRSELNNPVIYVASLSPPHTSAIHDVDGAYPAFVTRRNEFFSSNMADWFQALREADELWIGGGGLIGNMNELRYTGMILAARIFRTPVRIVANGATKPIDGTVRQRMISTALMQADAITVRDKTSLNNLKRLDISEPIDLAADPVFNHIESSPEKMPIDPSDKILVAPKWRGSNFERDSAMIDFEGFATALDKASRRLSSHAVFLSFNQSRQPPDSAASELIATEMDEDTTVINESMDFRTLSALINNAPILVGMRLHSIIFALKHRTPFVGISYHEKCEAILREVGYWDTIWSDDIPIRKLYYRVCGRWQSDSFISSIEPRIQQLEKRANTWFRVTTSRARSTSNSLFFLLLTLFVIESIHSVLQQS